jgi:hypothetical protein
LRSRKAGEATPNSHLLSWFAVIASPTQKSASIPTYYPVIHPIKKNPRKFISILPGTGVSVRTTYCSEERDGKHEKRSEKRPVKPESDELPEFLKLLGSDHIPMLISLTILFTLRSLISNLKVSSQGEPVLFNVTSFSNLNLRVSF